MTTIEKTLRWICLIGLFALPFVCLIVANSFFFPFITGKNFAFRVVVEVITVSWLALACFNSEYRPKRSWIFAALAAFVAILFVADLLGVVPFKSIWSNFERMDGWITLIHLLAYVFVAASLLHTENLWKRLFQTSIGVSVFTSFYGLVQLAGLTAIGQASSNTGLSARIDARFGNPIYFAIYLLFHIFLAALLWAQSSREYGRRAWVGWAYGGAIVLDTIALFLTGTRGTMLGLIGGALLALMIYSFLEGSRRLRTWTAASIVVVLVAALGLHAVRDSSFVKSVGFLDRLASISLTDTTITARFINTEIAWQGIKERPVLGWGQENFAIVWDKYYDPRLYADEPWFDRVHDSVFDWWIAGGTLGLLGYLSLFAVPLYLLWRREGFSTAERAILTGLLAGYFVHNLTVFDNLVSYLLFGTVLAYLIFRTSGSARPLFSFSPLSRNAQPYVALVTALLVWGVAWYANAAALAQNRTLLTALMQQSDYGVNLADFQKAISYGSFGTQEAREQLAQAAAALAQSSASTDLKQQYFNAAVQAMKDQEVASPLDARFPLFLATIYNAYGDVPDAMQALQQAHTLSPKKQSVYYLMGQAAFAQGNSAAGLGYFRDAYELDTANTDAALYYAAAAIRIGQSTVADDLITSLEAQDRAADTKLIAAYDAVGQLNRAVPIWLDHLKRSPSDVQGYFTLAAIYYKLGERAQAVAALKQAETVAPQVAPQAEQLIQQIQSGTAQVN